MHAGGRGDLRQVGDHDHLPLAGQPRQPLGHGHGHLAADAHVHLVEDHRGGVGPGVQRQGQHDAAQLAAARRLFHRGRFQVGARGEEEAHLVGAVGLGLGQAVHPGAEAGARHPQGPELRLHPRAQLRGGPLAGFGERRRGRLQPFTRRLPLGAQRLQTVFGALELGDLAAQLVREGEHRRQVAAVLALEPLQLGDAPLHRLEPLGVGLQVGRVGLGFAHHGRQRRLGRFQIGGQRLQLRRQPRRLPQLPAGGAQAVEGVFLRLGEQVEQRAQVPHQLVGVAQAPGLGLEGLEFARLRGGLFDLVQLETQHVEAAFALGHPGFEPRELFFERAPAPVGGFVGFPHLGVHQAVEGRPVAALAREGQSGVLGVEGQPGLERLLQLGQRDHLAVDAGYAARRGDAAAVGTPVHPGGDEQGLGAGADQAGVGLGSQQQPQRPHEDRLPGPGLAGQHRQAGAGLEHGLGQGGEVLDLQAFEHPLDSSVD